VLAALAASLTRRPAQHDLPTLFERELQGALGLRTVRLRELPPRYQARLVTPTRTPDAIVISVPSGDPRVHAVLEASSSPERRLDDRDHAVLTVAAELAGLVLEAARSRPLVAPAAVEGTALVGVTPVMLGLRERLERVAVTDFTVMIEGESGTGKELVARQLHELSRRRNGPFVAVNCAAVVETLLEAELFGIEERTATGVRGRRGKFEHADGGTLFLDEVADLSLSAQAKLLRALQDLSIERVGSVGSKRVNTRIVVATNKPLSDLVSRSQFRADLFYRLSGVEIMVPSLRERKDDIPILARHFLNRHRGSRNLELSEAAEDALRLYEWPGNVRELERLMERAVALTGRDRVELDDLPPHVRGEYGTILGPSLTANDTMRMWGSRYARLIFERCGRNKRRACQVLGISYHTLQSYLRYANRAARLKPSSPAWVRSMSHADPSGDAGDAGLQP
jgi:transcriptional regulator with PAS, ATPase and Fis domain